jgi:hypothetical protein
LKTHCFFIDGTLIASQPLYSIVFACWVSSGVWACSLVLLVCCFPGGGLVCVLCLCLDCRVRVSGCWAWLPQASCSRCLRGRGSVFSVYPVLHSQPRLGRIQRALYHSATRRLRRQGVILAGRVHNGLVLLENSHYPAEQRAFTTCASWGSLYKPQPSTA